MERSILAKVRKTRTKRRQDSDRTFLERAGSATGSLVQGGGGKAGSEGRHPYERPQQVVQLPDRSPFSDLEPAEAEVAGSTEKDPARNHRSDHPSPSPRELWLLAKGTGPRGEGTITRFKDIRHRFVTDTWRQTGTCRDWARSGAWLTSSSMRSQTQCAPLPRPHLEHPNAVLVR